MAGRPRPNLARGPAPGALVLGVALALAGCFAPKGPALRNPRPPAAEDGDAGAFWQPRPQAVRIYPSTRFLAEDGVPLLDARFELFDQMGHSLKASGRVRFELFAVGHTPGIDVGRLLYSWDVDLTTARDQQRYYDPITRGYLIRLGLDSPDITRREVLLRVTFQLDPQTRLVDEQPVRTRW